MNVKIKHITAAVALAMLSGVPAAYAAPNACASDQTCGPDGDWYGDMSSSYTVHTKTVNNNMEQDFKSERVSRARAQIDKEISITHTVTTTGQVNVSGDVFVEGAAASVIDDTQANYRNYGDNMVLDNDATINGDALKDASGNIGVNVTAGDNNMQDNAAAISALDASVVFGSADSEVFTFQDAQFNDTINIGTQNNATIADNVMTNATGNIGVNVSAGNSNLQKNNMATSVASNNLSTATVSSTQQTDNNSTWNAPIDPILEDYQVVLSGTSTGTYAGHSDQDGDVYPDTWTGDTHSNGNQTGHIDLDSEVQGASDPHGDGGALNFIEDGDIALTTVVSGNIPVLVSYDRPTTNTASIGDSVLTFASGNIGVNIAAGTNNLQNNSLALSSTYNLGGGGEGPGNGIGGGGENP